MEDISWFRKNGFNISVEFYESVRATYQKNISKLQRSFREFVYDEFVLNDLTLIVNKNGNVDLDISDDICGRLKNSIIMQVVDIIDISKPFMSESKTYTRRLLKLKLTNGVNIVYAFECGRFPLPYEFIGKNYEKLLIKNGAEIRRGLLLLSESNCFKLEAKAKQTLLACETQSEIEQIESDIIVPEVGIPNEINNSTDVIDLT